MVPRVQPGMDLQQLTDGPLLDSVHQLGLEVFHGGVSQAAVHRTCQGAGAPFEHSMLR